MYKWNVIFHLKNGEVIETIYQSKQCGSLDAIKEIMPEKMPEYYWFPCLSVDESKQIVIRINDVSCLEIGALS